MLDAGDALDLIDHLVDIHGRDHTSSPCYRYPMSSHPDCIVGNALFIAGATLDQLSAMKAELIMDLWKRKAVPVEMTFGAALIFRAAQQAQDGYDLPDGARGTWGDAKDAAHRTASRIMALGATADVSELATV